MQNEYGIDHTGYMASGRGNAPSSGYMYRQQMDRFHTDRSAAGMDMIDPWVTRSAQRAQQAIMGANNSAAEARQQLYREKDGQLARDVAMRMRREGLLGSGDPISYAHNITRGVTGGGFGVTIGGQDDYGDDVYGAPERVTGNGAVAARVAQSSMRSTLTGVYGSGTPDPRKNYGFDMTEASMMYNRIAQNGGLGNMAHLERNASVSQRVAAMRQATNDPIAREALGRITASTQEELKSAFDTETDPITKRELKKVMDTPDALFMNKGAEAEMSRKVKAMAAGLASLADVYKDASPDQLVQKMESISGIKAGNLQQIMQQRRTVNNMIGVADASGMDREVFMQAAAQNQNLLRGRLTSGMGLDPISSGGTMTRLSSAYNENIQHDSVTMSGRLASASQRGSDMGMGDMSAMARSPGEIAGERTRMTGNFHEAYPGYVAAKGAKGMVSEEVEAMLEPYIREFEGTSDERKRHQASKALENILAREVFSSGSDKLTFGEGMTQMGDLFAQNVAGDRGLSGDIENQVGVTSRATQTAGRNAVSNRLKGSGMGGSSAARQLLATKITSDLGASGITDLVGIFKNQGTAAEKDAAAKAYLRDRGFDEQASSNLLSEITGGDGTITALDALGDIARTSGVADTGANATGERGIIDAAKIKIMESSVGRQKITSKETDLLNLNSIVTSFALGGKNGGIDNFDDPAVMALTLQELAKEDPDLLLPAKDSDGNAIGRQVNVAEDIITKMNLSNGMSGEELDRIKGVHGGGASDLMSKLGYKTIADMEAGTKTESGKRRLLEAFDTMPGLNVGGTLGDMSMYSDDAGNLLRDGTTAKGAILTRAAKAALQGDQGGDKTTLDAEGGFPQWAGTGAFNPDDVNPEGSRFGRGYGTFFTGADVDTHAEFGTSIERYKRAARLSLSEDGGGAMMSELDKKGDVTRGLQGLLVEAKAAQTGGATQLIGRDGEGKPVFNGIEEVLILLKSSIEALTAAAEARKEMKIETAVIGNLSAP